MSAFFHIETDLDCKLYKFGEEIATIYAGRDNVISFHQGRLKLEFVALMNSEIREQMTISIPSEEYEDFIEVKLRSRQKALIPKSLEDYSRQRVDELVSIYSEHNNRLLCRINRKYGYTDASGEIVIPCQYGSAKEFDNNLAAVETGYDGGGYKWGCIDSNGNMIIPDIYRDIYIGADYIECKRPDGQFNVYLQKGLILCGHTYDKVFYGQGEIWGRRNGELYYILDNGDDCPRTKWMSPAIIDYWGPGFNGEYDMGDPVAKDSEIHFLYDGEDKIGFADDKGNIIVRPQYDQVLRVEGDSVCIVLKGDRFGAVNLITGQCIPCEYDVVRADDGQIIRAALYTGCWGIINWDNEIICDFRYRYIAEFHDNLAVAIYLQDGKVCKTYINERGIQMFDIPFDTASDFKWGLAIATQEVSEEQGQTNSAIYLLDNKGNVVNKTTLIMEEGTYDNPSHIVAIEPTVAGYFLMATNNQQFFSLDAKLEIRELKRESIDVYFNNCFCYQDDGYIDVVGYGIPIWGIKEVKTISPNQLVTQHPYPKELRR